MSKILITGNGFDLFHYLPTKYEHFILVMKTIEEIEINEKVEFDDLFGYYFKQVTNIDYNYIKENYFADEIIFDKNKILEIKDKLSSNALYKHFKNILEIDTWIDFENEIENILYQISSLIEYFNEAEVGQKYFDRNLLGVYINFSVFGFCENGPTKSRLNDEYIDNRTRKINEKKF